jgi:hypothetical protein
MTYRKIVNDEGWLDAETRERIANEAKRIKSAFRQWLDTEGGRDVLKNLFQVFAKPPTTGPELDYARFAGRMEILQLYHDPRGNFRRTGK